MADDLHSQRDVSSLVAGGENALLVKYVPTAFSGGNVHMDQDNRLVSIEEGTHVSGGLINTALYVLTPDIFDVQPVAIKEGKEYGLPQTIVARKGVTTHVVTARDWIQISCPEDIYRIERTKATGKTHRA
jgi:NDP-sugar pyrophosphorylase family protein